MKTATKSVGMIILGVGLFVVGCAQGQPSMSMWQSIKNPEVTAQLKSFIAEKEAQADATTNKMPSVFKRFFAAAEKGDWLIVSNMFFDIGKRNGHFAGDNSENPSWRGIPWESAKEIWGGFAAFSEGDEKYSLMFGTNIIASIPAGSIYFGGTDAGRFIVTAMQKSHVHGNPFFTLTQNALADGSYPDYLRGMYGDKIYIPSNEDSQKCFQDYMQDVAQRRSKNQLKPGEDVKLDSAGKIQVSGQVAVMQINGLLIKVIFDKNPGREFYIEESFPFDWMYPYLEPHGLIMKINRQPQSTLPTDVAQRDHDYWAKLVAPMIGDWLHDDTSVGDVAAFAQKIFGKQDFTGFTGDPRFIQNAYSHRTFSKLRSSLAGVYAWRAQHAAGDLEKERMNNEADFAYRQAWALCPYSPEAVFRYVNLLLSQNRIADALVVAETAAQMPSMQGKDGDQIRDLVKQLGKFQQAKRKPAGGK
jgi:hypothetical protein